VPTLAAPPQFVEAQQPVTLNNVSSIQYLGRLDLPGTLSTLFNYALSPDATRLVALSNDQVLAWNLLDGTLLFQVARGEVTRVFYSSDKTEIYALDNAGTANVLDANTGRKSTNFLSVNFNGSVAQYPDSDWLALGGRDGSVKVWDAHERQSLVTINAQSVNMAALAFSADGESLATAGVDGVVRLWRWRDRALVAETMLDQPVLVQKLTFAPDGSYLAIGTERDARLWALNDMAASEQQVYTLNTGRGGGSVLAFSPEGRFLLAGNSSAGLSLWNIGNRTLAARLPDTQGLTTAASFSPDGNMLLTTVLSGKVSLWNLVQVTPETLDQAELKVGTDQIVSAEWTADSRLLLFFDATGPVYMWGIGQ
jgi:WD40 repeat protein